MPVMAMSDRSSVWLKQAPSTAPQRDKDTEGFSFQLPPPSAENRVWA